MLAHKLKKRDGAYVEGAEAGMIFNTVLNEVYEAEKGRYLCNTLPLQSSFCRVAW